MESTALNRRLAGIGLVLVVLGVFGLTGGFYFHAFDNPAEVTVETSRAGLVMDPGNKVKVNGVEIGRVGKVEPAGDSVEIVLEIDRDEIGRIPASVTAEIRASTVFGAKYVELVPTAEAGSARLADGDVIAASRVTTEVNTVFDSLNGLLSDVDISALNSTLSTLSTTLAGRGGQIADLADRADRYLTALEPSLPQLRKDLLELARFARLGAKVSPAVIRVLRNATVTAETVTDEQQAIDRVLVSLSLLGGEGEKVLGENGPGLGTMLRSLRPTAETLRVYSTELPCLLKGLDETRAQVKDVLGGRDPALRVLVSLRAELPVYKFPQDLPGLPKGTGPTCAALPKLAPSQVPYSERGGAE